MGATRAPADHMEDASLFSFVPFILGRSGERGGLGSFTVHNDWGLVLATIYGGTSVTGL